MKLASRFFYVISLLALTLSCEKTNALRTDAAASNPAGPATEFLPPEVIPAKSLVMRGYEDGRTLHLTRSIAPGVTHQFDSFTTGPLTINTVQVNPKAPGLRWEVEKSQDDFNKFETVWATSKRLDVPPMQTVFAVNADFWAGQNPIGFLVDEGWIWRSPYAASRGRTRSVFAFDNAGNFSIAVPQFEARLEFVIPPGVRYIQKPEAQQINQINVAGSGPVTLYNKIVYSALPAAQPGQYRALVRLKTPGWLPNQPKVGTVQLLDAETETPLDDQTIGLISTEPFVDWMTEGADVQLIADYSALPGVVQGATGGGPMLVTDGNILTLESAAEESVGESFVTSSHPRTAVGQKANGELVFVTVDGRQGGRSVGINLFDLAKYMKSLGCVNAMNLDGGGSTTMVVRGEVINFPSTNGAMRPVSTSIVFSRDSRVGENQVLTEEVLPRNLRVPSLDGIQFFTERLTTNGTLTTEVISPEANTEALLRRASTELVTPASIEFPANTFSFTPGQEKPVLPRVLDAQGVPLNARFLSYSIEAPDFMEYNPETKTLIAKDSGLGTLTVQLSGGVTETYTVSSGQESMVLIEAFDQLSSTQTLSGVRYNEKRSRLNLNGFNKRSGESAVQLEYFMLNPDEKPVEQGTAKIEFPVEHEFPENALGARMLVYGDGKGHWLRSEWHDAAGQKFVLNWTSGATGVDWNGEWRELSVSFTDLQAIGSHASSPKAPFTLESIYLVQTAEAKKSNGEILFDDLMAVLPGSGK